MRENAKLLDHTMQNEIRRQLIIEKIDAIIDQNKDKFYRETCRESIKEYVDYLQRWLRTHNVISRKNDIDDIWINIYDSLIISELVDVDLLWNDLHKENIVDAGSGGGFPGVPLAIVFANKKFLLVDSSRKKCSFLRAIKSRLNIKNMSVYNGVIDSVELSKFIITKAAFSPSNSGVLANSLSKNGHLLIWASAHDLSPFQEELKKHHVKLKAQYPYQLAEHAERSLLLFYKTE